MFDKSKFTGIDFAAEAHDFLAKVREGFWNKDGGFAKEKLIGNDKAFLWPYGGHAEAIAAQFEVYPDCEHAKELYLETLDGIRPYMVCRSDGYLSYAAANGGGGDVYYDDNAWLVIIYMNAYKNLGDKKWLELAERICHFCYSAWDEKMGGGLYWMQNNFDTKNTCINSPIAKVSAELYKITGKQEYLDWSKKIYAWTKDKLMDPEDGLYFDSIKADGKIDKVKFTYNTGCMIGAAAHLYDITREEQYLSDAKRSAMAALNGGLGKIGEDGYYRFYHAAPWFNTWLLDGYLALYPFDPNDDYIYSFASAVALALSKKNASGFIPADWQSGDYPDDQVHILDQSGTAKVMYDLELWKRKYGKEI